MLNLFNKYVMSIDINALSWSIIIYSGMQYFVITFSISAFPNSSDLAWYMGTVIKYLVTSSSMHKIKLCPLCDLGMTFKSMLNLDNGM